MAAFSKFSKLSVLAALTGASLALSACGAAEPEPRPPAPRPVATVEAPRKLDSVKRADIEAALKEGPRWVVRRVAFEPAMVDGKFVGWRLPAVPAWWAAQGLQPGDVVQKVNGKPLVMPKDFNDAWVDLHTARELRVEYQRGADTRALVIPIVGEPTAPAPNASVAPPPPTKGKRNTIVIEGEDGLEAERASD